MTIPTSNIYPYYKFVDCCGGPDIFFSGTANITNGGIYNFTGASNYPGSGGILEIGHCYTVTTYTSQTLTSYPVIPTMTVLSPVGTCTDEKCKPCDPPPCDCPPGYILVDGECVMSVTTAATYSGGLLTVDAGDKSTSYSLNGLRLYTDISSYIFPIIGSGPNASFFLKDNNGTGLTIPILNNTVKSLLWGSYISGCLTGSTGGKLNTTGIWATGYPVLVDLCFDFCVEPLETKQYLIGIAGDNSVKIYIDGVLLIDLIGNTADTVPFTSWHVFPITLTAGLHTITLCGENAFSIDVNNNPKAFGAEIYNIDVTTFQALFTNPAIGPGNCGNVPSDLDSYILFSTSTMIGQQIADPNDPGVWTCPDGSVVSYCQGAPTCVIEDKFPLECPCYLLSPCNGTGASFISNTLLLSAHLNQFVSITYGDFTGCVYVSLLSTATCPDAIAVVINDVTPCVCDPICYYIEGADGITYVEYIDGLDQLVQITPGATPPWLTLCSKIYPIIGNTSSNYTITPLGPCIDNVCPVKCYKLIDCNDPLNILYSNSYNLLPYALDSSVIKIVGYTECWTVESTEDACDCAIDVIVTIVTSSCAACEPIVAYKLTSCNNTFQTQYTYDDLSAYINQTVLTDCGCFIVELIDYAPPSVQTIVIITSFENCEDCLRPYYKLTDCNTSEVVYTYTDVSIHVGKVIKIANCDNCWTVSDVIIPINPSIVTVLDSYIDCITCVTTAPCVCSTVRNDNAIDYTYSYIDCYGITQTVTVAAGATSNKICLIKWLEVDGCACIIETITTGVTPVSSLWYKSSTILNYKSTWYNGLILFIYYNGTQWIMNDALGNDAYYLAPSKSDCPSGIWKSFSSIPLVTPVTIKTTSCQSYYQSFGDCVNGVCPTTIYPKRSVRPGYNTPICSEDKYETITCKSAQILYRDVLALRYGISNCCPEDDEYWLVKKEIIDLAALYNPVYPCAVTGCACGRNTVTDCSCSR